SGPHPSNIRLSGVYGFLAAFAVYTGSQLLHLSARTRCRWSLRFQLSCLTLLLRRTNRSGPLDFLPRIFAEVAAHRHQVILFCDRFRSIQIGVDLIAAVAAVEIRLTRTDSQMQTARTGLRCVPRRDYDYLYPCLGSLV